MDSVREYLTSESSDDRAAATYLLGRIAEANRTELGSVVRQLLLARTATETSDEVLDAIAVAVSLSGLETEEALTLVKEHDIRLRRSAFMTSQ